MGIVSKSNVTGIDRQIQGFQQYIYAALKAKWNIADDAWTCYGRAYRNQVTDGYIPEVFVGNNSSPASSQDYKEVFFDDRLSASSFFCVGEQQRSKDSTITAQVGLIFCVNLDKIKPGTTRNDEEVHVDVERECLMPRYSFLLTGIDTGIDNVFKEFSGWRKEKGMKYRDMHPFHCFRLNFSVAYNVFDC